MCDPENMIPNTGELLNPQNNSNDHHNQDVLAATTLSQQSVLPPSSHNPLPTNNEMFLWQVNQVPLQGNLRYIQSMNPPFIVNLQFDSLHDPSVDLGRYSPIALEKKIRTITPGPLDYLR